MWPEIVFYGSKQKNSDNIKLQLDLTHKIKSFNIDEIS